MGLVVASLTASARELVVPVVWETSFESEQSDEEDADTNHALRSDRRAFRGAGYE